MVQILDNAIFVSYSALFQASSCIPPHPETNKQNKTIQMSPKDLHKPQLLSPARYISLLASFTPINTMNLEAKVYCSIFYTFMFDRFLPISTWLQNRGRDEDCLV